MKTDQGQNALDKDRLTSLEKDEWVLHDGIGTSLFGGDIWTQLNSGKQGAELESYIEDIKASARVAIDQSIAILTPWFFSNMPQFYYETTPREEKVRDLHAVITGHIFESRQKLQLWNRDRTKTTYLAPGNDQSIFRDIAAEVSQLPIKHGSMFTSNDRLLMIGSFFTDTYHKVSQDNSKNASKIERAIKLLTDENLDEVKDFLFHLDNQMVIHATPERLARLFKIFSLAHHREDVVTHLISRYNNESARLDIAYKKMGVHEVLPTILHLFQRYGFYLDRSLMATTNLQTDSPIIILTFIVKHTSGKLIDDQFVPFLKLNKACKTLRWVDTDHFDEMWKKREDEDGYSFNESNLVRSISTWDQIFLSKKNPYYYSEERIRITFNRYPEILKRLIHYFKVRFDPRVPEKERGKARTVAEALETEIHGITDLIVRDIFNESLNFLNHILKTNYFFPRKTGLAFRLDPGCLNPEYFPNRPYGFFFMFGRGYRGFHVRYRDTARGGLRIVMPRDASQYEVSFAGLFDEVIGLAFAQQLKNKDIPEGGAKAVLLLSPGADRETAAIGAVDSILNLITVNEKTGKLNTGIIDYFGPEENIYLGPDENCTNQLIELFVCQAKRRRYRFPNAFMSSKPEDGINHKEYGVTSEGVNVFLDNILKELGIKPREQPFTVRLTGGPDGDVAGNELKILHREYGENARVLAIADGYGAAYDPKGLNWKELLRLVEESKPISEFSAKALSRSKKAYVVPADTKENIKVRNRLHATVVSDVFIPAGGRPYTVNDESWEMFLDEKEKPSARAIVEGANIFFTPKARQSLQEKGVLIFKDSSANKCGVICSSFEILASLILSTEEFVAIKEEYVAQVVEKLRHKADLEAKLLLREFHERGRKTNLVELSKILSSVINRITDLISAELDRYDEGVLRNDVFDEIILEYVPQILREHYSDRVLENIPLSYRKAIVSADTASQLVYSEGINWFENMANEDIVATVRTYMRKTRLVRELLGQVERSKLKGRSEIAEILRFSGARALTSISRRIGEDEE